MKIIKFSEIKENIKKDGKGIALSVSLGAATGLGVAYKSADEIILPVKEEIVIGENIDDNKVITETQNIKGN